MEGRAYCGVRKTEEGKYVQDTTRQSRTMKDRCSSRFCAKSSMRKCAEVDDNTRKETFDMFWKQMDWGQKKTYIANLVEVKPKERTRMRSGKEASRRKQTMQYYLNVGGERRQVCQKMFLNTFGINVSVLHGWLNESENGMFKSPDMKRHPRKVKHVNKVKESDARGFLGSLSKLPSHYCRADTGKEYLETTIPSKTKLYEVYRNWCQENGKQIGSRWLLMRVFNGMNLGFHQPKKDQCDICCSYQTGNITEPEYQRHLQKKDRAREEKLRTSQLPETKQLF